MQFPEIIPVQLLNHVSVKIDVFCNILNSCFKCLESTSFNLTSQKLDFFLEHADLILVSNTQWLISSCFFLLQNICCSSISIINVSPSSGDDSRRNGIYASFKFKIKLLRQYAIFVAFVIDDSAKTFRLTYTFCVKPTSMLSWAAN